MSEQAMMAMPKYKCNKEVWALKIKMVGVCEQDGSGLITPEDKDFAAFKVSKEYMDKHKPYHGGYYVVYVGGYKSFSPADAFESGYALLGKKKDFKSDLDDLIKTQEQSITGNEYIVNEYMRGMANGLVCARSVFTGDEPDYFESIPQTEITFVGRLYIEHDELRDRLDKLQIFIISDACDKLPDIERKSLRDQMKYMTEYLRVLSYRVSRTACNA